MEHNFVAERGSFSANLTLVGSQSFSDGEMAKS